MQVELLTQVEFFLTLGRYLEGIHKITLSGQNTPYKDPSLVLRSPTTMLAKEDQSQENRL